MMHYIQYVHYYVPQLIALLMNVYLITNIAQLQECRAYLAKYTRNCNRQSKYDPLVEEVELLDANPEYIHVKFANGRESTISLWDLAPHSKTFDHSVSITPDQLPNYNRNVEMNCETVVTEVNNEHSEIRTEPLQIPTEESTNTEECINNTIKDEPVLHRSVWLQKAPEKLNLWNLMNYEMIMINETPSWHVRHAVSSAVIHNMLNSY